MRMRVMRPCTSVRRRARPSRPLGAALAVSLGLGEQGCGGGAGPVNSGPPGIDEPRRRRSTASGGPGAARRSTAAGNLYVSDCSAARVYVVGPSSDAAPRRRLGAWRVTPDTEDGRRQRSACPGRDVRSASQSPTRRRSPWSTTASNRVRQIRSDGVISTFAGYRSGRRRRRRLRGRRRSGDGMHACMEPVGVGLGAARETWYVAGSATTTRSARSMRTEPSQAVIGRCEQFSGDGGPPPRRGLARPQQIVDRPRTGTCTSRTRATTGCAGSTRQGSCDSRRATGEADRPQGTAGSRVLESAERGTRRALRAGIDRRRNGYYDVSARRQPHSRRGRHDRRDSCTVAGGTGLAGILGRRRAGHTGEIRATLRDYAFDESGNLYVADTDNRPDPGDRRGGTIRTFVNGMTSETRARTARARTPGRPRR